MNIAQLAQELLDKNSGRVSVAVKVCVDNAQKMHGKKYGAPEYEDGEDDDDDDVEDDVEDDDPAPAPMKNKMSTKPKDDEEEEDVYVDDLDEQYEIDLEGKKKAPKR